MSEVLEREIFYSELTGKPEPHSMTQGMRLRQSAEFGRQTPLISIVVPTFNKAQIIESVLSKLVQSVSSAFELIVIDDASTDGTSDTVWAFLQSSEIEAYALVECRVPVYETACDNIGISLANGQYFLEVQSDIYVDDPGFEKRMIQALDHGNLASISGRAGHAFGNLLQDWQRIKTCFIQGIRPHHIFADFLGIGLLGQKIYKTPKPPKYLDRYWTCQTNNRGPWLVKMATFDRVGPLDSVNFFLGNDDHEFNYRCFLQGMQAGYIEVRISSEPQLGSTRQKRTGKNLEIYEEMKRSKTGGDELFAALARLPSAAPKQIRM